MKTIISRFLDRLNEVPMMTSNVAEPIGKIEYSNYPKQGLYRVTRIRRERSLVTVTIFGVLMIPTSFDDDGSSGILLTQIISGGRRFERNLTTGRWQVS